MTLPERSLGVHEYRAAMLSVFLHTLPRNDPARLVIPSLQTMMPTQAIEQIHRLPGKYRPRARAHAAFRLAGAAYVERREGEFEPLLRELLDSPEDQPLRERLQNLQQPTYNAIFEAVYAPLGERWSPPPASPAQTDPLQAQERQGREPQQGPETSTSSTALAFSTTDLPEQRSQSTLDLETLTTTVRIQAPSLMEFKQLSQLLDPRSWSESPFWPEAYQVDLSADGLQFNKVESVAAAIGQSWHGYFFEHVEWNWNTFTVSSFRNFLDIDFRVDEGRKELRLDFSLHSCEGSQLFLREARNGVDVDWGFLNVDFVGEPQPGFFRIDTQKVIRFSDILDRRTSLEGPVGSGQILSFMAPAIVGLWMHDLLCSLYLPAS